MPDASESGNGPAVEIASSALSAMLAHARDALPNECCGLLVGTETRIERAERARNLKASPTRYEIDPADHFRSIRVARAEGLAVIGAYHSHPRTAPEPSPTDLVGASDPALLCVIVSPATSGALGQHVGAFRLVDDRFVRVALVVGDSGRPETPRSIGGEPRSPA